MNCRNKSLLTSLIWKKDAAYFCLRESLIDIIGVPTTFGGQSCFQSILFLLHMSELWRYTMSSEMFPVHNVHRRHRSWSFSGGYCVMAGRKPGQVNPLMCLSGSAESWEKKLQPATLFHRSWLEISPRLTVPCMWEKRYVHTQWACVLFKCCLEPVHTTVQVSADFQVAALFATVVQVGLGPWGFIICFSDLSSCLMETCAVF